VRSSRSVRVGSGRAVGLVIVALAVAKGVDRAVPGAHVAVGLGLIACLVAIARAQGLTTADLGLARSGWPAGLRWGATAAALVGTAYALAYVTGPVQEALPDGEGGLGRTALWTVLVVIPLGTVLPEELAFRGLLLALLGRRYGLLAASLLSSGLFGLWHVVPSLGGGTATTTMASVVGADAAGTVVRGRRHRGLHVAGRGRAVLAAAAQRQPAGARAGPLDGQRSGCHRGLACLAAT
jgi:membrane protease YdiL (CAAX protease family)